MGIVCGIITFIAFYIDMIWMNCIYPEMYKNKKTSKQIESNSKKSSLISMIVLAIIVAISYFAKLSDILLFASSASLFMCALKYITFTKFGKMFKEDDDKDFCDDYEDDKDYPPRNIFEEYEEEDYTTFEVYDGEDEEDYIETIEDELDDEEFVDIIDGKTYI